MHKIVIGADATVAMRAIVTPGAILPDRSYIWPNASSYEMQMNVDPVVARKGCRRGGRGASHCSAQIPLTIPSPAS